jgi:hypothetical protein
MFITPPPEMLEMIRGLELSLHQNAVRRNAAQLQAFLHNDFMEIGRSGQTYNKTQMVQHLAQESAHTAFWSQDFKLSMPSYSVALLTYHSAQIDADDQLTLHTVRSSLWQLADTGWQLCFHQGTPVQAFTPKDNLSALLKQQQAH